MSHPTPRPEVYGCNPCFSCHHGKGIHSPSSDLSTKDSAHPKPLGSPPKVSLESGTGLHQHLLWQTAPGTVISPWSVPASHGDRKSGRMAEPMQHPNLTLSRKLLSEALPGLTYQVSPETIGATGPQGPIRKPGPAEGIRRRARMELDFQAFHFTTVKTHFSGTQRIALPQY